MLSVERNVLMKLEASVPHVVLRTLQNSHWFDQVTISRYKKLKWDFQKPVEKWNSLSHYIKATESLSFSLTHMHTPNFPLFYSLSPSESPCMEKYLHSLQVLGYVWTPEGTEEFSNPAEVTGGTLPWHRISLLRTDIVIHCMLYSLKHKTTHFSAGI